MATYLALARRERPQRFAELVGQEHIVRTLQNSIKSGRVHHAYLFCGTRGVGKTSTARIFAKALNCESGPTAEPCNTCGPCRDITEGSSVDVVEIDAATHRGVEEAQRFLDGVQYRPVRFRTKIYIVDEVHMMTRHAFNALLKTFEEPPPHVKFVLATTEAHQVPDTILSRCQRFDFRELGTRDITDRLERILAHERVQLSPQALSWVVREARGSMRDAQSLLDQVLAFAAGPEVTDEEVRQVLGRVDAEHVEGALGALAARDPGRVLAVLADVAARGHDLKAYLAAVLEALRAAMVAKAVPDGASGAAATAGLADAELETHGRLLAEVSLEDVLRWIDLLLACQAELQKSEEPRLTLEAAFVRATTLTPVRPLAELVARVEAVARQIGAGTTSIASPSGLTATGATADAAAAAPRAAAVPATLTPRPAEPARKAAARTPAAPPPAPSEPPPLVREDEAAPPTARGDEVERVRAEVARAHALLARHLDRADRVAVEGDVLRVSIRPGVSADELREPTAQAALAEAARGALGRPCRVLVESRVDEGAPEAGRARRPAAPERASSRQLRAEAVDDPFIKEVLGLFGGEIVDVRPLDSDER